MNSGYNVVAQPDRAIFRSYDIRGEIGKNFTEDVVYTIGLAIGSEAIDSCIRSLVIGRDGRLSGPSLIKALSFGIRSSGCDVVDLGEVPTPFVYYATSVLDTNSGIMLTGSHNPPEYNGLKITLGGKTIYGSSIQDIYTRIVECKFSTGSGMEKKINIIDDYVNRIVSDIKIARPLKVVVDCGNGVPGKVVPGLFKMLGCDVIPLFCEVDGNFPNHHPDPTVEKNLSSLIKAVIDEKADLGMAFDGDGDRIGLVTNSGKIIYPDRVLMYFSSRLLKDHPSAKIVYDVKCTRNLPKEIVKNGGIPIISATGHSLVKAKMREVSALLAGEFSGHIFIKDRWYGFDDAIYTGARLLELFSSDHRTLDNIFSSMPNSVSTPELKIPVNESEKFSIMKRLVDAIHIPYAEISTIDGIRADFEDGFGLIRASNTTPFLIARFEGDNESSMKRIEKIFQDVLRVFGLKLISS